jgi:RNA polymerase sigma factor (sigma-70 family)
VRAGNLGAAAAFHDRVRPLVDRTLDRLIGRRDPDYEDLVQRALMDLVLSLDKFLGEGPLDAWASVVVARVAYKHIRRRKVERRVFALELVELPDVPDQRSAVNFTHRWAIRQVHGLLEEMDPKKAWTFVLHDVFGFNLTEVSRITGVSKSAAQSRLVRGRRMLHQRIAQDPELRTLLNGFDEGGRL